MVCQVSLQCMQNSEGSSGIQVDVLRLYLRRGFLESCHDICQVFLLVIEPENSGCQAQLQEK